MEEGITIEQLIRRAIDDDLTVEIEYAKNSFEKSSRVISDISVSDEYGIEYISAYCHMRKERRTFKISRIMDTRIVPRADKRIAKKSHNYEFDESKTIFNLYGEEY